MLIAIVTAVVLCGVSASEDEGQEFLRVVKALEKRHSDGTYHEEHYPVVQPHEYPAYLGRYVEDGLKQRVLHNQFLDQKLYPGVLNQSPIIFAYRNPLLSYPFPSKAKGHRKGEPCHDCHLSQYHQEFFYPGGLKQGLLEKPIWLRGQDASGNNAPQLYQDSAIQYAASIDEQKEQHKLSQVIGSGELPDGRKFQLFLVEGEPLTEHDKKTQESGKESPKEENPEKRKSDVGRPEKETNQEQPKTDDDGRLESGLVDDIDPRSNEGEDSNIQKKSVDAAAKGKGVEEVEVFTGGETTEKQPSE